MFIFKKGIIGIGSFMLEIMFVFWGKVDEEVVMVVISCIYGFVCLFNVID